MVDKIEGALNQVCRAARVRALYPVGHPSHATGLAMAREALDALFELTEQVELALSGEGLACEGEALPDPDGSLRQLALALRDQQVCALTLRRGLSEGEIRLLLELFGASEDAGAIDIVARLQELGAECVTVVQLDYERLVPRQPAEDGTAPSMGAEDGPDLLRLLAAGAGASAADFDGIPQVITALDDPEGLAAAMLSGAALRASGSGTGLGGSGDGIGPGGGDGVGTGGDLPLVIAGRRIERPHMAGAALALSVQRLAEMGCEGSPESQVEVYEKLAAALRQLDPQLLAHTFRADVVAQDAPFDALREIANHLSLEELLTVVRAHPEAVASEPSAVYRRLLRRLAPTGQRLLELTPALKDGLLEDGMTESVFVNTLGQALKEAGADRGDADDTPLGSAAAAGLNNTSESLRAARREELGGLVEPTPNPNEWTCRATLCLELLQVAGQCDRHLSILEALQEALGHISEQDHHEVSARILEVLAPLAGPSGSLPAECRDLAVALLAEVSDGDTLESLRKSLMASEAEQAAGTARALAVAGDTGRSTLLDVLLRAGPAEDGLIRAAVSALVDVEMEEIVADTQLARAALDPQCRQTQAIITALAEKGGPVASRHLIALLREGDFGIRSEVVRSACQPGRSLLNVLVVALDDTDEDIRCAAVASLGASGDEGAAQPLLRQLRPFAPWDPHLRLRLAAARALGQLGCPEAVTRLAEVLRRTSWLRRSECDELRAAAAGALLKIGTKVALQAVAERSQGERSRLIAEAATAALRLLKDSERDGQEREEEAVNAV